MELQFNIGIEDLLIGRAIHHIQAYGFTVQRWRVSHRQPEATLIAVARIPQPQSGCNRSSSEATGAAMHKAARDMGQDCIAAYDPATCQGWLEGPVTAPYGGAFDYNHFEEF